MYRAGLLFSIAAVAALAPLSAQAQTDRLQSSEDGIVTGEVVKMTPLAVTIERSGVEREHPVNTIERLSYAQDPRDLATARTAALSGRLEDALESLNQVDVSEIARDVIKQDVAYYKAYTTSKLALAGNGDKAAAAKELLDFIRQNQGSYHFFEATELLGDLEAAQGNYDQAAKYYGYIGQRAPWPDYKVRSNVLKARTLLAQGKYSEALQAYEEVLGSGGGDPQTARQKQFAAIGKARALAHTGEPQQAISTLEEIINNNSAKDTELFAKVYAALGDAYLQAEQPRQSLLQYLKVHLLYYGDSDAHAEALYHLSDLWRENGKPERAVQAKQLLQQRYGGTQWASRSAG